MLDDARFGEPIAIARPVMQDATNDQFLRPVKFRSFECFQQPLHFSSSMNHSAFARSHWFDVHSRTSLIVDDIKDEAMLVCGSAVPAPPGQESLQLRVRIAQISW